MIVIIKKIVRLDSFKRTKIQSFFDYVSHIGRLCEPHGVGVGDDTKKSLYRSNEGRAFPGIVIFSQFYIFWNSILNSNVVLSIIMIIYVKLTHTI